VDDAHGGYRKTEISLDPKLTGAKDASSKRK
jgi:hypothetical protein